MASDLLHSGRYRRNFALLFLASVALLIYASILPVQFRQTSFKQALDTFTQLPWLNIELYGRADWVANLLALLPLGWFASAAIDWNRNSRKLLLLMMPLIIVLLCLLVFFIEFIQAWFPNRTQSLNDIAAGCLGAVAGPVLWVVTGRWTVKSIMKITETGYSTERLWQLALLYAIANLVFSALPMDFVLSLSEIQEKAGLGRLEIIPATVRPVELFKLLAQSMLRIIPLVLLLCFSSGIKTAVLYSFVFSALCEVIQIPVFTRTASIFHFAVSLMGTWFGVLVYRWWWRFCAMFINAWFWFSLGVLCCAALLSVNVLKAERVLQDPIEISYRWQSFFDWPMAGYYYQSEFGALTSLMYKMSIFGFIGICFGACVATADPVHRRSLHVITWFFMLGTSIALEVSQIYLPPHLADAFDICLYIFAMLLGAFAIKRQISIA